MDSPHPPSHRDMPLLKKKKKDFLAFVYSFVFDCLDPPSASLSVAAQADTHSGSSISFVLYHRLLLLTISLFLSIFLSIYLIRLCGDAIDHRLFSPPDFFVSFFYFFVLLFFQTIAHAKLCRQGHHRRLAAEIAPETEEEECSSRPCVVRASCSIISGGAPKDRRDIHSTLGAFLTLLLLRNFFSIDRCCYYRLLVVCSLYNACVCICSILLEETTTTWTHPPPLSL